MMIQSPSYYTFLDANSYYNQLATVSSIPPSSLYFSYGSFPSIYSATAATTNTTPAALPMSLTAPCSTMNSTNSGYFNRLPCTTGGLYCSAPPAPSPPTYFVDTSGGFASTAAAVAPTNSMPVSMPWTYMNVCYEPTMTVAASQPPMIGSGGLTDFPLNDQTALTGLNPLFDPLMKGIEKPLTGSTSMMTMMGKKKKRVVYSNNILYKTILCHDFTAKQTCPRGKMCQFAHGESDLHHPNSHELFHSKLCDSLLQSGSCPRGNRCYFAHSIEELRSRQNETNSNVKSECTPLLP